LRDNRKKSTDAAWMGIAGRSGKVNVPERTRSSHVALLTTITDGKEKRAAATS